MRPGEISGDSNAFYKRHVTFDQVVAETETSARDKFEAIARSVHDRLSQRWVKTEQNYRQCRTIFDRMTMNDIKQVTINIGDGDPPGLNAVIHVAHTHGWEIHGIRNGFDGKTAVAPPSFRQSPFPPAGKTEISAALVQPLPQIACKEVKRKKRVFREAKLTSWRLGLF